MEKKIKGERYLKARTGLRPGYQANIPEPPKQPIKCDRCTPTYNGYKKYCSDGEWHGC
jgi:hypothetical protein